MYVFCPRLGDGQKAIKDRPVEVKLPQRLNLKGPDADLNGINIVGVACGSRHSFIWSDIGQAFSFGNNFYAQLGYDFQRADFKEHQVRRQWLAKSKIHTQLTRLRPEMLLVEHFGSTSLFNMYMMHVV